MKPAALTCGGLIEYLSQFQEDTAVVVLVNNQDKLPKYKIEAYELLNDVPMAIIETYINF